MVKEGNPQYCGFLGVDLIHESWDQYIVSDKDGKRTNNSSARRLRENCLCSRSPRLDPVLYIGN